MIRGLRLAVAVAAYAVFAVAIGYLSASPVYHYGSADMAVLKLSLDHAAERVEPCVRLTPAEVAALPPDIRQPAHCERQRIPLRLQLDVDGMTVIDIVAQPSGLWDDGPASVYERFEIEPGTHSITVRLRDGKDTTQWDYVRSDDVVLAAGRYFTITFDGTEFRFR